MPSVPLSRRIARRARRSPANAAAAIELRWAVPSDRRALERVAALDERAVPSGRLLVAEVEGALCAALAVDTREAVANPFVHTADALELLDLRAAQIGARAPRARRLPHRLASSQASATVGA